MAEKTENKDERIGFHKGSLATLSKEREELARILSVVEQLMHMHIEELKKQGVDLAAEMAASGAPEARPVKKVKGKKDLGEML